MNNKIIYRSIGFLVLIISSIQHIITAQVSVPFWDPGELSAAAYSLQVPHPPGGPLFSMVGRIFYMLPIPGDIGYRMNFMSALASSFTVFFLYLIMVKVIENFKGKINEINLSSISTYIAAFIGALTLSFSDTFWFNAGESNYFAASMLLYSSIIWLMMLWNEKAEDPSSDRYLICIIYITGLSAGLHLMSVLTILIVGITVVLRRYVVDSNQCFQSLKALVIHSAILLFIACLMWLSEKSAIPPTQEYIDSFETKFLVFMGIVSIFYMAIFYKKIFNRNSYYIAVLAGLVFFGIIFAGVIRYLPKVLLWIAGDHLTDGLLVLLAIVALLVLGVYWAHSRRYKIISFTFVGMVVAILGFTTYALIVIRSNANPPMNENHPNTFSKLISYLNREQYGNFPTFKRRWTNDPDKAIIYQKYKNDLDFFWNYQMDHMFNRYVGWNFIGRESHDQDAGIDWSKFYGIPFFIGLFGLYFHFRKDWKMASVFLFAFILMGYLITYYQNQQEPQPRDREYFYCGAYFVFALWIGLGVKGLLDLIQEKVKQSAIIPSYYSVAIACAVLVPGQLLIHNYPIYDRSKNWVPWDFAYNMLQSCEKDAILVTQGDNDTFPLWYMQDVEGVRRDVRIVNLSLVNTPWYILQLKNKPAYPDVKPVPMNMSNRQAEEINYRPWETKELSIDIPLDVIQKYIEKGYTPDTSLLKHKKIFFTLKPTMGNFLRVQDIALFDIILASNWERPIYFANTCSPDAKLGLDNFLWLKGLTYKLEPIKVTEQNGGIDLKTMEANLLNEPTDFSKTPSYGYKFRELANPNVFFDENTRRIITNYRMVFLRLAQHYLENLKDQRKAEVVLEKMESIMPSAHIPIEWQTAYQISNMHYLMKHTEKIKQYIPIIEKAFNKMLSESFNNKNLQANIYYNLANLYEMVNDYDKAISALRNASVIIPTDRSLQNKIMMLEYRSKYEKSIAVDSAK